MANVNDIVQAFNELSERNSFDIFIPSLKRNVKFKPLTSKQQKSFYACLVDSALYSSRFVIASFEIIKENCLEPDIINTLTTIDRIVILLTIRKNTMGSAFTVLKDNAPYTTDFELSLQQAATIEIPESKTVTVKNVKVELHTPLAIDQYGIEKELRSVQIDMSSDANTAIENAILNESCKIIKNVWLIDNDTPIDLNYTAFSYKDRITLVENLPAEIIFEIQEFVTVVNKSINKLLTADINGTSIPFRVDFFLDK